MSALLFYLFIKPLSLLPFWILYGISDFLYLVVYKIFGYRKEVINGNLTRSFPDKSAEEIKDIQNEFYHHFFDLIMESIKVFSITKKQVLKRYKYINPEIMDRFYEKGQNLIMAGGHFGNWEYLAVSGGLCVKHQMAALYFPLSNAFFDRKMQESRGKFGFKMIPTKDSKNYFNNPTEKPTVLVFGADQSPSNPRNAYWVRFLNQDTGFVFGIEKYAREYNQPVVFGLINKLKRGHYSIHFEVLIENPKETEYGEIVESYARRLEDQILKQPEYWLWSHKRWKRKKPDDVVVPGSGNPNNVTE